MVKILFHRKLVVAFTSILLTFYLLVKLQQTTFPIENNSIMLIINDDFGKKIPIWKAYRKNTANLTKLGKILFLDEPTPKINSSSRHQILVWKYGPTIEQRHLQHFSNKKIDPFESCSVNNCDITYKDNAINTADIVIFHLHRMVGNSDLPKVPRNPNQIWAFLTDESPYHTFLKPHKLTQYNGVFNWSITYRMDSDIPVPYGRTVLKTKPVQNIDISLQKRRDVLVAILSSNCGGKNNRWDYVRALQKYIKVDVYGACGSKTCPGHFRSNCEDISKYMFYLAFENSNCDEYITEKLWWNAFEKNSIPIVMGASPSSYQKLLPVESYINVDDFASPAVLAEYLLLINRTGEYESYYEWKGFFNVLNEHGYFKSKSYHYCRICEALNYNERVPKTYKNLDEYWSIKRDCHPPWNSL